MSNARQLAANLPREGGLSNRNMVINGGLTVWQRGTSFNNTSSTSYTADRWFAYRGTVSRQSNADDGGYSLRWTYSSSNSTTSNFISQMIEDVNCKHTRGQYITLSFEVKADSTWGATDFGFDVIETSTVNPNPNGISQSISNKVAVTADWQRVTKTFGPIAATTTNLCITFGRDSATVVNGEWFEVRKVQLEVGDTATPFEHRSYGQELALCQRYFQKQPIPQYVYPTDAGQLTWVVPLSVPLRTTPTITAKSAFYAHRKDASGIVTLWDGTGLYSASVYEYEAGEISIRNNFDGGVVAGIYTINASPTLNNTNSGLAKLYFDAEL